MITEIPTTIEDIVTTFQSQQMPNVSQDTQLWILMEMLGGIPEEVRANVRNSKWSMLPNKYVVPVSGDVCVGATGCCTQ